jgi:glycosyltransferase involved in cell wall biosynthesis
MTLAEYPNIQSSSPPLANSQRVSIFLPTLAGGGAERAMLHLAQGFAQQGLKTDLVVAVAEGAYLEMLPPGVNLVNLHAKTPVVLSKTLALRNYLRQAQPDVLFSALDILSSATWARRWAGTQTRVVMCVQTHLSQQFRDHQPLIGGKIRPQFVRWFYPWADEIVAASQGVAIDVAQIANLPVEDIRVVYNPVLTPEVRLKMKAPIAHPWFAPGQPPVVLGVGRLVTQKDFLTLIRAFALLRQQRPARLMILGEGGERPKLEALIQDLGVTADVALPGFVENPYAYMAQASVFALSSIFEGFGNVVAEALATGTPVVSTDCESGPAEILADGEYGILVPMRDPAALATAIATTLDRPPNPDTLRQRAEEFSMETITQNYLQIINND